MSKVVKMSICAAALFLTVFSLCAFAYGLGGTVTGAVVNIRESSSTDSSVLATVEKGTNVNVVGARENWYRVEYDGMTGWISSDYLDVAVDRNQEGVSNVKQPGVITGSIVNVRESHSVDSKVLDQLEEGARVTITGIADGWRRIASDDAIGWVSADYIEIRDVTIGTGIVKEEVVNVRSEPNKSANIVATVEKTERVAVLSVSGDWYKVKTADGIKGWIFKELLTFSELTASRGTGGQASSAVKDAGDEISGDSGSSQDESGDTLRDNIVAYAKKFLGVPYLMGGSSPKAFDCSGFVQYVLRHFGISIDRVAADQARKGTRVKRADLRPGDLIFFDTNGGFNYINHVGIYIGGNRFIHASSGHGYVMTNELSGTYLNNYYMTARNVLD